MTTTEEKETTEIKVSPLCRFHLKTEAAINTLIAFILACPVICIVFGYKSLVFITTNVVPFLTWVVEEIAIPVCRLIYGTLATTLWICITVIESIVHSIIWLLKKVYSGVQWLISIINWCALRSLIRMGSLIVGIISTGVIINGIITIPPTTRIITGMFYDANNSVYTVHVAIVMLMLSIGMYYNSWAYSRSEEVTYVCNRTWGFSKIKEWLK